MCAYEKGTEASGLSRAHLAAELFDCKLALFERALQRRVCRKVLFVLSQLQLQAPLQALKIIARLHEILRWGGGGLRGGVGWERTLV